GSFHAGIHGHFERSGDTLRSYGQSHLRIARKNERAARCAFVINGGGNFLGRLVTQVPGEFIQAGFRGNVLRGFVSFPLVEAAFLFLFFAGECADDFSLRVQHFQLDVLFGLFLQAVVERGAVGRIFSNGIAAAARASHARANGRTRSEQVRVFGGDGGVRLA